MGRTRPGRFLLPALLTVGLFLLTVAPASARKRPTTAFLLSAFPGALVHGSGNYYAGERKTAAILFLTELFGVALLSLDHPSGDVGQRIGERRSSTLSDDDLNNLGQLLFFGSWLYDLGSSPDAARRHNDRLLRKGFEIGFEPVPEGRRTSFNPRASYTVDF